MLKKLYKTLTIWISYFATALNQNGRAGLVMANSASDAGGND